MLVLSRKNSESVVVGDPAGRVEEMIKVTVIEIGRGKVRLGFEGAANVPVHRWEVWQRIRSEAQPVVGETIQTPSGPH
jgi:carbon storage regulator CsrA